MPRAKALLLALAIIGVGILLRFQRQLSELSGLLHNWVLTFPALMASNWLAFGLGQTLVSASGVLPASMIAVMAGATLGFGKGLLLSAARRLAGLFPEPFRAAPLDIALSATSPGYHPHR